MLTRYPPSIGRFTPPISRVRQWAACSSSACLDWSDGPTAVLWVAVLASLGGVAFAKSKRVSRNIRRVAVATTSCLAWRLRDIPSWSGGHGSYGSSTKGVVERASALREVELLLARPRDW